MIEYFEKKNEKREKILKISRDIVKDSSIIIRKIQKREQVSFFELEDKLLGISNLCLDHPEFIKYLQAPEQEYVEAKVYYHLVFENRFLNYSNFKNVSIENYILGLCDVIGELRRKILESIKEDDFKNAECYFFHMENIYDFTMKFDYYNLIDGLRRKQDVSRSILEKTHGDLISFTENLKLRTELSKFKP